jgi:hypothetical protein
MQTIASTPSSYFDVTVAQGIIEHYDIDGKLHLHVWERDCDMMEVTRRVIIDANITAYRKYAEELAEGAEGPYTVELMSREESDKFTPSERDRIMEAYENGNTSPYFV